MADSEDGQLRGETLRWLQRIDQAVEGLRADLAAERRTAEAKYVTAERHRLELDLVRTELHTVQADLAEQQERTKYAFRTAVGAVIAVITGLVLAIVKIKLGV